MASMEQMASALVKAVSGSANNHYTLRIDGLCSSTGLSVLSIKGQALLNQPWRYDITFTSADKHIAISSALSQSASLTFEVPQVTQPVAQISSLEKPPNHARYMV